jgi:DNA-binding PadR family transcriptional regulator
MSASPVTYGLLGMLAVRSWTGYELTQQLRRSLRFVWSSSEGHLYREQKRLVELGWATVEVEASGARSRKRYLITPTGEAALLDWLTTAPQEPHFEIEGLLRLFFADHGTIGDMVASLESTASEARNMLGELLEFVEEYLADGGPLWMLEHGIGGPDGDRLEFAGRPMFPERLHVVALVIDAASRLLGEIEQFCARTAIEARAWRTPTDPQLAAATRARLEAIRARHSRSG